MKKRSSPRRLEHGELVADALTSARAERNERKVTRDLVGV